MLRPRADACNDRNRRINEQESTRESTRTSSKINEDIQQIATTYRDRTAQERYAYRVAIQELIDNDYNRNISRYVSTAEAETEIDLSAVRAKLGPLLLYEMIPAFAGMTKSGFSAHPARLSSRNHPPLH